MQHAHLPKFVIRNNYKSVVNIIIIIYKYFFILQYKVLFIIINSKISLLI